MANVYDKLKEMNITLPAPPPKGGVYTPVMEFGDHLLYCSGCGPQINGTSINGKLGKDLTVEQGQEAALRCMLNLLANLDAKLGDLNRIKRFVKVLAFVNSADDFTQQPQVVNGGSQLLLDLFGEEQMLSEMTNDAEFTGAIIIGGGISKHHVIWWNQFRGGLDYCIYLTTAEEYDGSLSGARIREAVSWGKVKEDAKKMTVEGDATISLPLIYAGLAERLL